MVDTGKVMIVVLAAVAVGVLLIRCANTRKRVTASQEKEVAMHRRAQQQAVAAAGGAAGSEAVGGVRRETALALEAVADLEAGEAAAALDAVEEAGGGGGGGGDALRRGTAAALQAVAEQEAAEHKAAKKQAKKAKKSAAAAAGDDPDELGEGEERRSCVNCGRSYITQSGNPICPACRRATDESADESKNDRTPIDPARLNGTAGGVSSEYI
jgi:hypothetical protein